MSASPYIEDDTRITALFGHVKDVPTSSLEWLLTKRAELTAYNWLVDLVDLLEAARRELIRRKIMGDAE